MADLGNEFQEFQRRVYKLVETGDPGQFDIVNETISDILLDHEECTQELFDLIVLILKSPLLYNLDRYSIFLINLSAIIFSFSKEQALMFAKSIMNTFFSIDNDINRISICDFIRYSLPFKDAIHILSVMLQKARRGNFPQLEISWAIASLANDTDLDAPSRATARSLLSPKSLNEQ